jgi:hypothetical protein
MAISFQPTELESAERQDSPEGTIWFRELAPGEQAGTRAKTGDVLADGSILLRREDMDRMGLNGLRDWIMHKVLKERATVVIGESALKASAHPLEDEAVS